VSTGRSQEAADWRLVALIALIGIQLRTVIVGVSPVVPELRTDLHLSFRRPGR
jgi:cyanate permease